MDIIRDFGDEASRVATNLSDMYHQWIDVRRQIGRGRLQVKESGGHSYLYRMSSPDTGKSLGRLDCFDNESFLDDHRLLETIEQKILNNLKMRGAFYKAAKLPTVARFVGQTLREFDIDNLLGPGVQVIGSTAITAYELEAGAFLPQEILATEDLDFAWTGRMEISGSWSPTLVESIRNYDRLATVVREEGKSFHIRLSGGQQIDFVAAPELSQTYPKNEPIRALPSYGQQWLLNGVPVRQVATDTHGLPCPIVAPDPRWFALHKQWMAEGGNNRTPVKRKKDSHQALAVMQLVIERMPHYSVDETFVCSIPDELRPIGTKLLHDARESLQSNNSYKSRMRR